LKILVINPVGHATWDEKDREIYTKYASPGTYVEVKSLPKGPKSIESAEDFAEAVPLVVETVKKNADSYDGFIVNCFLDPGVELAQEIVPKPVVGPGSASLLLASYTSRRVGIATVSSRDTLKFFMERMRQRVPVGVEVVADTIEIGVLDLDSMWKDVLEKLVNTSRELLMQGAEVIALGCTGLAGAAEYVSSKIGAPVIDPTHAALKLAEALISLGVRRSKIGVGRIVGRI